VPSSRRTWFRSKGRQWFTILTQTTTNLVLTNATTWWPPRVRVLLSNFWTCKKHQTTQATATKTRPTSSRWHTPMRCLGWLVPTHIWRSSRASCAPPPTSTKSMPTPPRVVLRPISRYRNNPWETPTGTLLMEVVPIYSQSRITMVIRETTWENIKIIISMVGSSRRKVLPRKIHFSLVRRAPKTKQEVKLCEPKRTEKIKDKSKTDWVEKSKNLSDSWRFSASSIKIEQFASVLILSFRSIWHLLTSKRKWNN